MPAPTYLTASEVIRFNKEILLRAGQTPSPVRDRGLLESALQRPQHAAFYEGADLLTQAALTMVAIALNHPFVDGNKRTGYVAGLTFLALNGVNIAVLNPADPTPGVWLEQVVTHTLAFDEFVEQLRGYLSQP